MSENNKENRPLVGVGVYIINDQKEILMSLRSSVHAAGYWCPPGGHIEYEKLKKKLILMLAK